MSETIFQLSLALAAISAGLMGGVYFAFSGFIMQSFDRLGTGQAAAAMNSINEVILRSWFMPLFFGSSLLHLLLSAYALYDWNEPGAALLFTAGLVYFAGMFLCTVFFNVPLNNRLANARDGGEAAALWRSYYRNWTRWNHVRTASSAIACALGMRLLATWQ